MPPLAYADQHEQGGDGFFFAALLGAAVPRAARDARSPPSATSWARRCARPSTRNGYPSTSERELRPPLPRLRRQRDDAALRSGRDDARGRRRAPVRAARRRAPGGRPRRRAGRRASPRRAAARRGRGSFAQATRQGARGVLQHRDHPRVFGYALGAGAEPLVARLLGEGVAVRRLAAPAPVASLRPYGSPAPGAPATLAAGTYLVSAAQPLKHWIEALLGQNPSAGGPVDVRRQRVVAPAAHGRRAAARSARRCPPRRRPRCPRCRPPSRWPDGGWRCWATRPRSPRSRRASSSPTRARAGRAGSSRASARRSTCVDDAALAAGALAGHDAVVVADGAPATLVGPGAGRRSPPSSPPAGPTSAGARGASRWRAPPASPRRRSPPAPAAISIPGAAVAVGSSVVVDNDDPLVVGGHVVATYGAVLSGWTVGLAGRAPGDPRRARRRGPRRPLRLRSGLPRRPARAPRRCSRAR